MTYPESTRRSSRAGSIALLATLIVTAGALAAWKGASNRAAAAEAAGQPEPVEAITVASAEPRTHRSSATAIGTVLALQSVTLRNELAGTVRHTALTPGRIVEPGTVLVALDVSVELADLRAREAQAALAQSSLQRLERLLERRAVSVEEADRARAERDVAQAEIARIRAIIGRKTIRAPFRARIGLSDVHPGQYLSEGTELTTLQGVSEAANVDFTVAQSVAAGLEAGDTVLVSAVSGGPASVARITAIDARVDPTTRNALVRARLAADALAPGASVRVQVPVGGTTQAVAVPVSALRKGPAGDHVFVVSPDKEGKHRAHLRSVQAGEVLGDEVLILGGLAAGEQVAASGAFKLREAVLVAFAGQPTTLGKAGR